MTNEELVQVIQTYRRQERAEVHRISVQANRKCQEVLNEWAQEHAEFKVGDIITYGDYSSHIIKVDKVTAVLYNVTPVVWYEGVVLTKALKPRKDGFRTTLYDEQGRNITKIR